MRTEKTIKNFIISTFFTSVIAIIGLVKSKYFLTYLGNEMTGIYQLFSQLYSYISLVDAGLTSSLLFNMYKPISDKDYKKINNILKAGRDFFNIIALIILIIGILVSFKIDFFIKDGTVALSYIQLSFILFILSSSLNYLVTARKTLFEADQNIYVVHTIVYSTMIIKAIVEVICVICGFKLLSLMVIFLITSIIQNIIIYIISKKKYKYLTFEGPKDNTFIHETKNLIVQRFGGLIFNNIDVILISKFIGPASIVIYTCYNYISNSLLTVIKKIGTSSLASVGNLLVTEKEKAKKIFLEYNALCYFLAIIICVPLLFFITPFIKLYYGAEYALPLVGVLCVVIIFFLKVVEMSLDIFISALGYFEKIKNCIIFQSVVNLILSIIFVFKFGITGVLLATVISYLVGEFIMYPRILNKNYFQDNKIKYYQQSLKLFVIAIINTILISLVMKQLNINNILMWFIYGMIVFVINFVLTFIYFKLVKEDKFIDRFKEILKKIKNKILKK